MSLLHYEHLFSNLKHNTRFGGEKSPHKVAMLLAVIELIDLCYITDNQIFFDKTLKESFRAHFNQLAEIIDGNSPHLPFFDLRDSGFWHHYLKPGKTEFYSKLTTASGPGVINENIAFSFFDDELFELLSNNVVRQMLNASLHKNLSDKDRRNLLDMGGSWNWLECEAIAQDYFIMLNKELVGIKFNKAEHRRALVPKLNNRSNGSIEFKHQNISAVLIELGQPYIQGYKPAFNYQQQLKQVVLAHMAAHENDIEELALAADIVAPPQTDSIDWTTTYDSDLPIRIASIHETKRNYLAHKTNFSQREHNNRQLGESGERFVIEFERYRLERANRSDLAKEVEWSSNIKGDGLGYDIRSFNTDKDEELFIEVKTTNSGKYQPFFITENEVAFSKERSNNYSLYRVYDFRSQARIFELNGAIDTHVSLQAQSYKARFN